MHCNTKKKLQHKKNDELALSEAKDTKSEFCALSGTVPDPALLCPKAKTSAYTEAKCSRTWKGIDASQQAEDSLAYMVRLDWPREGKILAPPIWRDWLNIEKAKS